jgi:ADP-ribose pyrophosphatase
MAKREMTGRRERLAYNGNIFKVYQWRQKMFDGSYQTFERAEREDTVQVIPVLHNKIVVTIESQPHYKGWRKRLVGGRIDRKGETPLESAKRELLEEAGMVARRWKLVKRFDFPSEVIGWETFFYAALDCRKVRKPELDPGEKIRLEMVGLDRFLNRSVKRGGPMSYYFARIRDDPKKKSTFRKMLGLADS